MKNTCIIVAAGNGSRMKSDIPKQYIKIEGRPLIAFTIEAWQQSFVDDIVLVVPEDDIYYVKEEIVSKYDFTKVSAVVSGGANRYDSVMAGLDACDGSDYVYIHDGARPCIDIETINRTRKAVEECGAATVAVPVKDTIKVADEENFAAATPDRNTLWAIQTPQAFSFPLIRKAYSEAVKSDMKNITDDAGVVEGFTDTKVKLVMGDYRNIKVTTPEDLVSVRAFLAGKI